MVKARIALSLLLCFPALAGRADMIDTDSLKPWETCALCHGLDGVSRMGKFPKLANQPYAYLVKQLEDFRNSRRSNDGGMMVSNAELLTPETLRTVARYFSALPPPSPSPIAANVIGRALFLNGKPDAEIPACQSCHGATPPDDKAYPRLEGQHASYITKQLRDFKEQARRNDGNQVMQRIASQLTASEISAVAGFVAGLERK